MVAIFEGESEGGGGASAGGTEKGDRGFWVVGGFHNGWVDEAGNGILVAWFEDLRIETINWWIR